MEWGITRETKTINHKETKYVIKKIYPVDFMDCVDYPLHFYELINSPKKGKIKEKSDAAQMHDYLENLSKDKNEKEKLDNKDKNFYLLFNKAIEIQKKAINEKKFIEIKNDEFLFTALLNQIFNLAFNTTTVNYMLSKEKSINYEFAKILYFICQKNNCEPFSMIADISKEAPMLLNAKRMSFNLTIYSAGIDIENEIAEKQNEEYEKQIAKFKSKAGKNYG